LEELPWTYEVDPEEGNDESSFSERTDREEYDDELVAEVLRPHQV